LLADHDIKMALEETNMSKEDRQHRHGEKNLRQAAEMCRIHADSCRECFVPIVDEEGNPQYESEACAEGAKLLRIYRKWESDYFGGKEGTR
jgi:hypothetical protein